MAKLPIDLSHFTKVSQDEHTTTLEHKKGHQIKLAHKALDPKMRGQLAGLPMKAKEQRKQTEAKHEIQKMAEGGYAGYGSTSLPDKPKPQKPKSDPKQDFVKGATESGWNPSGWKHAMGFAEGGMAEDHKCECKHCGGSVYADSNNPKLEESKKTPFADGGDVEKKPEESPININLGGQQPEQQISPEAQQNIANYAKPLAQMEQQKMETPLDLQGAPPTNDQATPIAPQPEQQEAQQAGSQAPQQPGIESSGPTNQLLAANMQEAQNQAQSAQQKVSGTQNEADSKGQLGQESAKFEQAHLQDMAHQQQDYSSDLAGLEKERQDLIQDINNGHIDPDHFMHSMDTGKRVSTAIGLILGGLGSGVTGGPNPVLQFLNQQIDRDIDAQKANLGKKLSLLQANLRQFGNLNDATNMTKVMSGDIIAHQLSMAAQKAQSPIEKARAQQAIADIQAQLAPMVKQLAFSKTLLSQNGGNMKNMDPSILINSIVPKEERPKAFQELKEAQGMAKAKTNIMDAFNKVDKLNTLANRTFNPLQSKRQIDAIVKPLTAGLSKETAGRFTEQDAGMLEALWPTPGDSEATTAEKRDRINRLISEKMNFPELTGNGIDPSKFNSTSGEPIIKPEHQKFADFAKKNPNHPASVAIKKKLGIQ